MHTKTPINQKFMKAETFERSNILILLCDIFTISQAVGPKVRDEDFQNICYLSNVPAFIKYIVYCFFLIHRSKYWSIFTWKYNLKNECPEPS